MPRWTKEKAGPIDRHTAPVAYVVVSRPEGWKVICACECHRGAEASGFFATRQQAERCLSVLMSAGEPL